MVTGTKISTPKVKGLLTSISPNGFLGDIYAAPAKGIIYGALMGSLLWSAILLLVVVLRG